MTVRQFIEFLQKEFPDHQDKRLELSRMLAVDQYNQEGYEISLDFPIIGAAARADDSEVCLLVDHGGALKQFGEVKKLE